MKSSLTRNQYYSDLDAQHLHLLDNVSYEPVFMIGPMRSGTTILQNLLAKTGRFNYVSGYHVYSYGKLLSNYVNNLEVHVKKKLREQLQASGIANRVVDNIQVSPDNPYEYGMILQNAGYNMRFRKENFRLADQIFRKIQYISSDTSKPLLLKNPADIISIPDIKSCYPGAKLILIARDPLYILNSQLKFWRLYFSKDTAFYSYFWRLHKRAHQSQIVVSLGKLFLSEPLGWRCLTSLNSWGQKQYLKSISSLPVSDYFIVKYEELCEKPNHTVNAIMDFLGLEMPGTIDFQDLVQPRSPKLLPEVADNASVISKRLEPLNEFWGYA